MKKTVVLLIALVICICFSSCGSSNGSYADEGGALKKKSSGYSNTADMSDESTEEMQVEVSQRKLIRTVELNIETKAFDEYIKNVRKEIAQIGGYIESSDDYSYGENRSSNMTVRIPAEKLDAFLSEATEGVTVVRRSENSDDVTENYIDTEARLKVMRAEEESLTELLKSAKTVNEIIAVKEKLAEVRSDIEAFEAVLKSYDQKVSYSTVIISVDEVERENESESVWSRIGNNILDNLDTLKTVCVELFVFAASCLPFITILVVIAAVVIIITVVRRKKNKKQ